MTISLREGPGEVAKHLIRRVEREPISWGKIHEYRMQLGPACDSYLPKILGRAQNGLGRSNIEDPLTLFKRRRCHSIEVLDLYSSKVSDDGLREIALSLPNLRAINLATGILKAGEFTDDGVQVIIDRFKNLRTINLRGRVNLSSWVIEDLIASREWRKLITPKGEVIGKRSGQSNPSFVSSAHKVQDSLATRAKGSFWSQGYSQRFGG